MFYRYILLFVVVAALSLSSASGMAGPETGFRLKLPLDSVPASDNSQQVAVLHFYRFNTFGSMIGYDIHLGDTVICRAKNKWQQTVRTSKEGYLSLWAKTEAKKEIPINLIPGKSYYIRCSTTTGIMVARPKLEIVDEEVGRIEYNTLQPYKKYLRKQKRSRR